MTTTRRRDLMTALVTVGCALASVRAGRAHWHVHREGTVQVSPSLAMHHGAPIRLGLRPPADGKDARGQTATLDVSHPLVPTFHATGENRYAKDRAEVPFQFCSGLTDVSYRADLNAYLDLNANGRHDPGEPSGTLAGSPLVREKELQHQANATLVIAPTPAAWPRPGARTISPLTGRRPGGRVAPGADAASGSEGAARTPAIAPSPSLSLTHFPLPKPGGAIHSRPERSRRADAWLISGVSE
jgi:hypothetical protein